MVDWKSSGTQLISGIVGSSLFLFGVTTFYSDYLQKPQVVIDTEESPVDPDYVFSVLSQEENRTIIEVKYTINAKIQNLGSTPATDVVVACLLEDEISSGISGIRETHYVFTDKPVESSEENFTRIFEQPKLVKWQIPRLAAGSSFTINMNVTSPFIVYGSSDLPIDLSHYDPNLLRFLLLPDYKISAAADQGTKVYSRIESSLPKGDFYYEVRNAISYISPYFSDIAPFIALSAASVSIIFIPRISEKIKHRRLRNEQGKMISLVRNEVKTVHDTLRDDINSKQIFPCKLWYSTHSDVKRQIFDNYDDYNSINNLYEELQIRDSLLTANSDAFMISNKELLQISNDILGKVRWAKYLMTYFSVPIALTVVSALAVPLGELVIFSLTLLALEQNSTNSGIIGIAGFLLLMPITGAVIAFALLGKIMNIPLMSRRSESSSEFKFALTRTIKIRLFCLCLVVGVIPLPFVIVYGFERQIPDFLSSLGLSYIVVLAVLEIIAMLLLVMYAGKTIKKDVT